MNILYKRVLVQLQTFNTSDHLLKKIALIIISYRIERKNKKKDINCNALKKYSDFCNL